MPPPAHDCTKGQIGVGLVVQLGMALHSAGASTVTFTPWARFRIQVAE